MIEKNKRKVLGIDIPTIAVRIVSANGLRVEAGTNGPHGGDAGHGGRGYVRLSDAGGSCADFRLTGSPKAPNGIEILFGGDSELQTLIAAFRFIVKALEYGKKYPQQR